LLLLGSSQPNSEAGAIRYDGGERGMVQCGADRFMLGLSWGTLNYCVRPYVIQGQDRKSREVGHAAG